jgi:hypothetical protein
MEVYSMKETRELIREHPKDELLEIIDQYIHHQRNREILKRKLLDGICYEELAEEFDLTPRQCKNIVKECQSIVFRKLLP